MACNTHLYLFIAVTRFWVRSQHDLNMCREALRFNAPHSALITRLHAAQYLDKYRAQNHQSNQANHSFYLLTTQKVTFIISYALQYSRSLGGRWRTMANGRTCTAKHTHWEPIL